MGVNRRAEPPEPVQGCPLFPLGTPLSGEAAKAFSGQAYVYRMPGSGVSISHVTFAPACRNNWHIHHGDGQTLLVTSGDGWYQEEGQPARHLMPGDVVAIPVGVKHWHGAGKDGWFSHLAVKPNVEGAWCEWLEPVSAAAYDSLGQTRG